MYADIFFVLLNSLLDSHLRSRVSYHQDYHWWWRSYLTSGSSGLYLFLYSIFYFFTSSFKMKKFVSVLLFFGYMGIISYIFFVMTGTMGFLACFVFVRKIYSSIKVWFMVDMHCKCLW